MKKNTKKTLMVFFIVLIMFFSSAAFVILSAIPTTDQTQATSKIPENLVVEGRIDDNTRAQLLGNGATVMEWHYYNGCCPDIQSFVDALPAELEYQILIEKIADSNDTSWAFAKSLRGEKTWNTTAFDSFLIPLCDVLLKPPVECGLTKFGNQSK